MQAKSFRKLLISCYNTVYKLWTSIKKDYIQYVMQDLVLRPCYLKPVYIPLYKS